MNQGRAVLLGLFFLLLAGGGFWLFFGGGTPSLPGGGEQNMEHRSVPGEGGSLPQAGRSSPGPKGETTGKGEEKGLRRAVLPVPVPEKGKILLAGRVVGPGGGGLAGVEVRLDRGFPGDFPFFFIERKAIAKARTGPGGVWKLSLDRAGKKGRRIFQVTALKAGYVPGRARMVLEGTRKVFRAPDIQLRLGTQVWGRVMDERGNPVAKASVSAAGPGSFHAEPVETDGKGRYSFPGFPAGKLRLTVDAKGFALAYRDVDLAPAAYPLQVDFLLTRGLSISGRVLDGRGMPIRGAKVQLERFQGSGGVSMIWMSQEESARTDSQGRFRIGGLEKQGSFRLRVWAEGFLEGASGKVRPGAQGVLITLKRGCGVRGRVLDFQGKPAFPFFVEGFRGPGRFGGDMERIEGKKDGTFFETGLRPGEWSFRAGRKPGLYSPLLKRTLRPGEVADLGTFRLPRPASLAVAVLDGAGKPVPHARVAAFMEDGRPGMEGIPAGRTDKDGICRLEGLSPGEWSVEVKHKDYASAKAGPFTLAAGGETKGEIRLCRGGSILVQVLERNGKPREGASLEFSYTGKGEKGPLSSFTLKSGPEGRARKDHVPPGTYQVRLQRLIGMSFGDESGGGMIFIGGRRRKGERTWKVRVEEGKEAILRITAPGRWKIYGVVQDAAGPARGVEVRLSPSEGSPMFGKTVHTGPDGSYALEKVDSGSYVLSWGRPGCAAESREKIELSDEGGSLEKNLEIPSGAIRGRAVDRQGKPVSGLFVEVGEGGAVRSVRMSIAVMGSGRRAAPFLPNLKVLEIRTGRDGRFLLEEVPAGSWTVVLREKKGGKILASRKVKVSDGRTADAGDLMVRKK